MSELLEYIASILFSLWVALIVVTWVRYEKLSHGKALFILAWLWPLLLFEDLLRLSGIVEWLSPFVGLFYFLPALMMLGLFLLIYPMLMDRPIAYKPIMYLSVGFIFAIQIPVLLLSNADKVELLFNQPVGMPLQNLPVYLVYWLSGFMIVAFGVRLVDVMQVYQRTLSEQVVDINYYRVPAIIGLMATVVGIGFAAIVLTTIVAFGFISFSWWQTTIHFSYASIMLLILILLLERRRYSPLPIDLARLQARTGDEKLLRDTLARAEKTMIERKAYKVIGLRIQQLANVAQVEPTNLAIASHVLLNRNFRAFVYHYRLEYAKKVLMRTDAKVSAVARRLGFHSERFLSDMFIKYIEVMAANSGSELPDPLDDQDDFLDKP